MTTMYLKPTDHPLIAQVCHAALPGYTGQKCQLEYIAPDRTLDLRSWWDGGTRHTFVVLRLSDLKHVQLPTQHPVFDPQVPGLDAYVVPSGAVVVMHTIFCGKDLGLTIYARADGVKLLPEVQPDLTEQERLVLKATRGLKSSYAGISDYRKHELRRHGLTGAEVDALRLSLQAKGMLTKANAITNAGKNAIAGDYAGM